MACYICEGGFDNKYFHAACGVGFRRRRSSGLCVRCGEKRGEDVWCDKCRAATTTPPFIGYRGVV